jgi:acetolactate decarboxylase
VDEKMTENTKHRPETIDLNQFKLRIDLKKRIELTLHFNSPSRKFCLSIIAFLVNASMKTRSVPAQKRPYAPLKEVTANQPEFNMNNIFGIIVGFRCPPDVDGINVPGYHLHFISRDRNQGGTF